MNTNNFTSILNKTEVASSLNGVTKNYGFYNITCTELLKNIRQIQNGVKEGSHFLRTTLKINENGTCLSRADINANNMASLLIIDCDKRINIQTGEELEGAPDPYPVSDILRKNNISHILYGSYSHYSGQIGNRYRIILMTENPYSTDQLEPTLAEVISLINTHLDGDLLANATENLTWSQPWYYPRKPINSLIKELHIEYLDGNAIKVFKNMEQPVKDNKRKKSPLTNDEISPIQAFNEQNSLKNLLTRYGFKKIYSGENYDKWLSPNSTSGQPGITVWENIFYSHHGNCPFNDKKSHDSFDLWRVMEGLSEPDAIKQAAKDTLAPDGRTVDEYNKSFANKNAGNNTSDQIIHSEILNQLLEKIEPVSFREIANITDDKEKIKSHHIYVIVIETILQLAKKNNWGLCRNHDFIYVYNGTYWNLIDEDDLKSFLSKAAEKMAVDKFSARYFNFREQLYKQFLASAHLPKPFHPKDIISINLKNGTFEISPNGTRLKSFDSNDFITYQLPFDYKPEAQCPLFTAYLNKVVPDKSLQNILSEYLGYVFVRTSTLKLEKALLLYGQGANGKSVFYEISRQLFGEQNVSEYSLQTLTDERGYSRAMMANKLLNYASEITGRLVVAIFKQMASGEPVEARLPYGNPFIMTDYAKLIFNCNDLPKDTEQSEAYYRRLLIIPFSVTIPEHEQDKQLAKKIIDEELSGVFNWVLDGLNRLLRQKKFTDSELARQVRAQYEKESDSTKLFLDEMNYSSCSNDWILVRDLYLKYRNYCLDNGYKPVSNLNFRKRLENSKIVIEKKNIGNVAFVTKDNEYRQAKERS